jgi:hypothetical protein
VRRHDHEDRRRQGDKRSACASPPRRRRLALQGDPTAPSAIAALAEEDAAQLVEEPRKPAESR